MRQKKVAIVKGFKRLATTIYVFIWDYSFWLNPTRQADQNIWKSVPFAL
jgi:hypothetical protein